MLGGELDIKIYFSKLCDCVMWNLFENPAEAYDSGKRIKEEKLNKIILPKTANNKILIVPVGRYGEINYYIDIGTKKLTYKNLFNKLYVFYNETPLSEEMIKDYMKGSKREENDFFKMFSKIASKKNNIFAEERQNVRSILGEKGKIYPIEIVGSLCRYEGLSKMSDYIYRLKLGS